MCTSISIKSKDNHHLVGRVMDFHIPLNVQPVFTPRNYSWSLTFDKQELTNKYCYVGTGRSFGQEYFVADGINEKGLSVSELYLPGQAVYQDSPVQGKCNLGPDELIMYLLGNIASIDELSQIIGNIRLVKSPLPDLNIVTPLHWVITDQTGRYALIEPLEETLTITDNPIGVLTNSPDFSWQIRNLRNYLYLQPQEFTSTKFGTYETAPFSPGTGSQGLPGGMTSPERFVRAAFLKEYIEEAEDEEGGVKNLLKLLGAVSVPRGIVLTSENMSDYSQYTCIMCNDSLSYYYQDYTSNVISKIVLDDKLVQETAVKVFESDKTLAFASPQ